MSQLAQALMGWVIIMGMVFGGVGVLFFVMSAVRALITVTRRARVSAPEATEAPAVKVSSTTSR